MQDQQFEGHILKNLLPQNVGGTTEDDRVHWQ